METMCLRCKGYGLLAQKKLVVIKGQGDTQVDPVECHECKGTGVKEFPGSKKKK